MSVEREIAAAVTTLVNGGTYSQSITAKGTVLPNLDLKDLGEDVRVLVMATDDSSIAAARGKDQHLVTVQTIVVKKIAAHDLEEVTTEVDGLLNLVQEINDRCRAPLTSPSAGWQSRNRSPIYDQSKLDEEHIFIAVTEHRYLHIRNV